MVLSGHTGNVLKWQSSLISNFSGTVIDIANTGTSLTIDNLTTTTYYRAVVVSGSCSQSYSSTAVIEVNTVTGGQIGDEQIVTVGGDPAAFREILPSTATGAISYQWQSSTAGPSSGFTNIPGATANLYDVPSGLGVNTWYKR
jgi:hypothetical protein